MSVQNEAYKPLISYTEYQYTLPSVASFPKQTEHIIMVDGKSGEEGLLPDPCGQTNAHDAEIKSRLPS